MIRSDRVVAGLRVQNFNINKIQRIRVLAPEHGIRADTPINSNNNTLASREAHHIIAVTEHDIVNVAARQCHISFNRFIDSSNVHSLLSQNEVSDGHIIIAGTSGNGLDTSGSDIIVPIGACNGVVSITTEHGNILSNRRPIEVGTKFITEISHHVLFNKLPRVDNAGVNLSIENNNAIIGTTSRGR